MVILVPVLRKCLKITKNLASIIRVSLYAFPDAPNSYITNGFSRFVEIAKSHCRIVKNVMVFLTFLWSFCRIGAKRAHFHSVYKGFPNAFPSFAKPCSPNGFPCFPTVPKTLHGTLIIQMVFVPFRFIFAKRAP